MDFIGLTVCYSIKKNCIFNSSVSVIPLVPNSQVIDYLSFSSAEEQSTIICTCMRSATVPSNKVILLKNRNFHY